MSHLCPFIGKLAYPVSSIALITSGTVVLTQAQLQTPIIAFTGIGNTTFDFGGISAGVYFLDCSAIAPYVGSGVTINLKNGSTTTYSLTALLSSTTAALVVISGPNSIAVV